ncbi:MAG: hypothetical protein KDD69_04865 [Bdellovibrionales bacterium]|nr:hypothetical protein [Bdellovibrionales bacterium]
MDDIPPTIDSPSGPHVDGRGGKSTSLSELYDRGMHAYSTRTCEGFEAMDRRSKQRVLLWLLRFPLGEQSAEAGRFVERLHHIRELMVPTPRFRDFGLDPSGSSYLVTDFVRGVSLLDRTSDPKELERLFVEALKAVVPLHLAGLVLGDLCNDSFVEDAAGRVLLLPVMGTFETGARQTAMLPPSETLHYLAPEQRMGNSPDIAADIYALGVFGYRLFTGRYLHGDRPTTGSVDDPVTTAPAPAVLRGDLPNWVDDVLGRCLEFDPGRRFRDAAEILEVVQRAIDTGEAPGGTSAWSRRTMIVHPTAMRKQNEERRHGPLTTSLPSTLSANVPAETDADDDLLVAGSDRAVTMFVWALALVIGVLGAGFIFFSIDSWDVVIAGTDTPEEQTPLEVHTAYAPDELKPLIAQSTDATRPVAERLAALSGIAESSDPTAYGVLISTMKADENVQLREAAERLLIERIRRQSLTRSADVIESWLQQAKRAGADPSQSDAYALLLRACDSARPMQTRKGALIEAYQTEQRTALQLAAALALDGAGEEFVGVLRTLLAGELTKEDVEGKGLGALLLSHPSLGTLIDQDLVNALRQFSDADLRWALQRMAQFDSTMRHSGLVFDLAAEVVRRKVLPPFRALFLETLVESGIRNTPPPVQQSLVEAALGDMTALHMQTIARWESMLAERVLLATCATAENPDVALQAFDILASRPRMTEPADSIIEWIKDRFWEYRAKAVKSVGVLGLSDIADPEATKSAFEALMPFSQGGMFRVMVRTGNRFLVHEAVVRLGAITAAPDLIPLLSHPDKEIRIEAIKALQGRNELAVLQAILRAYKNEKDPDVKEVFHQVHWVTRDRGSVRTPGVGAQ